MRFLSRILDILFPPRETAVLVRTATIESIGSLLEPTIIRGVTSLLPYRENIVQALIQEAKFNGNKEAQRLLGQVLGEYLLALHEDRNLSSRSFSIVPIPLSRARLRERGYNQIEEILMAAKEVFPALVSETDLLQRVKDTAPQTSLPGSARHTNMKDAFGAIRRPNVNRIYIVVDDVVTTGATLSAAKEALQKSGAASIECLALAH